MDFKEATDELTECVKLSDIADEAGVALNSVLRARMDSDNPNARTPPPNWREAVLRLAEKRSARLHDLIRKLRGS